MQTPLSSIDTGDSEFAVLYRQYLPRVLEYIRLQHGGTHPEAQDIAQDIFLILWRWRDKLTDLHMLENYLFLMVKHRLINDRKREAWKNKVRKLLTAAITGYPPLSQPEIADGRALQWWQAAVASLPPKMRTAYLLRERGGMKVYEVARRMGVSPAGASRLLTQAKQQILDYIAKQLL